MYAKGKGMPPSFLLRAVDELACMLQLHIGSTENAPKELHTGEVSGKQHLISTSFLLVVKFNLNFISTENAPILKIYSHLHHHLVSFDSVCME